MAIEKVVSGELAMRRLPAVLLDLHDGNATGKLLLRRGRINKLIDLADGDPISATSSAREETLGHFLASTGVITADVHREAVARAARDGVRIGEALIAMGALTPDHLLEQLTNQTRHKLVQALRWSQGAWRFDPGTSGPVTGIKLSMVDVVLSGLRDTTADVDSLRQLDGQEIELTLRGKDLLWELYRVFGAPVIDAIAVSGKVGDVERAVGDPVRARSAIEALLACGAALTKAPALGLGAAAPPAPVAAPRTPTPAPIAGGLYDLLFGELNEFSEPSVTDGAAPLAVEEDNDSGVFAIQEMVDGVRAYDQTARARKDLLAEHLRIQGSDHYGVLMVDGKASASAIATAVAERQSKYSRDFYARFDLGADQAKLDEIHAAYARAREVLLDDARRAAYDRELAGGELQAAVPAMASEAAFRTIEDQMAKGMWRLALPALESLVAANPEEPDYLVALGWCRWNADGRNANAADLARPFLNQALALSHDHAAGHDYKGRISLALDAERQHEESAFTEAVFHLERAVELDPSRQDALELLSRALVRAGEVRRLERLVKKMLYKISGQSPATEIALWVRLARIQIEHLDDQRTARAALASAQRISATAPEVVALAAELEVGKDLDSDTLKRARERWRRHRGDTGAGSALIHAAIRAGQSDAAFLVGSAMVALRTADAEAEALYQRDRPRMVKRASSVLDAEQWALLRDPEDSLDLGALIELLAPAIQKIAPVELADLDIDPTSRIDDKDLPGPFARLRAYFAETFGVPAAPVHAKPDLGASIHVAAVDVPVLIAGDDALTAPERPELAFRLARAMTFLWPGRALGASRPARVLKAVVIAMFNEAANASVTGDDKLAGPAKEALTALAPEQRTLARGAVLRLVARQPDLNLSRWARAVGRTADRAGLLLAGDLPAAVTAVREAGGDEDALIEFGTSKNHQQLRSALGLSIG